MTASSLSCSRRDLCCITCDLSLQLTELSGCGARTVEFSGCGTGTPEHSGSVVAVHRLSCSTACGILVPPAGILPKFPALQGRFLTTGPPGKFTRPSVRKLRIRKPDNFSNITKLETVESNKPRISKCEFHFFLLNRLFDHSTKVFFSQTILTILQEYLDLRI